MELAFGDAGLVFRGVDGHGWRWVDGARGSEVARVRKFCDVGLSVYIGQVEGSGLV